MTNYITFQCTVCRKTKNSEKDILRVVPNVCTITQGCNGRLIVISEKSKADALNPSSKLAGSFNDVLDNPIPVEKINETNISTSEFGTVTAAVRFTGTPPNSFYLKILQRKIDDVQYQQYVFKTTQSTTKIPETNSSKDISGRFLRFDSTAISENRVTVLLNGVVKEIGPDANEVSLEPNKVNFNTSIPSGSVVSVIVYAEQQTTVNTLEFIRNDVKSNTDLSFGSWANIKRIDFSDSGASGNWYVYSCVLLSNLVRNTAIRIDSVVDDTGLVIKNTNQLNDVRLLLASSPFSRVDRYYNFVIKADDLSSAYQLTTSQTNLLQLIVNSSFITEIYPPIEIKNKRQLAPGIFSSDYIIPDTYESQSSVIENTRLQSVNIIGPV